MTSGGMMNAHDLRQKSDQELQTYLSDARVKLHELSFKAAAKQLKEVGSLRVVKRDIARCMTVLRERRHG